MSLKFKVVGQVNNQSHRKELIALVASYDVAKVIADYFAVLWLDVEIKELENKTDGTENKPS